MNISTLIKQSPLNLRDTLIVLEHVSGFDKNYIYLHQDILEIDDKSVEKFNDIVCKVQKGMPLQYAIGKWWFFGHEFFIEPPVLIPRPETEILVEKAIEIVKDYKVGFEPFVGSGIVSISLLKYYPHLKMVATDINKKACELTLKNAKLHKVEDRILVVCSNIADAIKVEKVDFLVANPPYIPTNSLETLDKNILEYEDIKALDGKEDGLFFYKKLKSFDVRPMLMEIGHDQEEAIKNIFGDVEIVYDYYYKPRVAIVR
ncbi:N5-glutamine methyltransferase family protein [Hydrogenobaculum acidophilum]